MFDTARQLLRQFKGDNFVSGFGVLPEAGRLCAGLGRRAVLVRDVFPGSEAHVDVILASLRASGVEVCATIRGAAPNAPLADLARIEGELRTHNPDVIVSFGGGSTIDCTKAAEVLHSLGGSIEDYFGMGLVTAKLKASGASLAPHLAIQSAASSAAHLTKYSNITDVGAGQKKLIVDEAIVPARALFDNAVTLDAPESLTADGGLDGLSHCLEVYYGAAGKPGYERIEEVALTGIALVMEYLPRAIRNPRDREAREALGYATDLGGYSIMLGGTNGAHLTSFSLIDILSHGRACALMNPYYTVFYAPAIQAQLRAVAELCARSGLAGADVQSSGGRLLAEGVARALVSLERSVGNPATLGAVPGFSPRHVERALTAAKNPQLRMKLENMPVPLRAEEVDDYMGPVLQAAVSGDFAMVRDYGA
ncbi:MAG: iron-containing alcohol dehydrogenase [Candidatus Solibacter sp.]|nr:iron-containing alcohol dehydrogenase [Candidatus Solibacter sp.]